jgi:N-acetylglucosamine repressor
VSPRGSASHRRSGRVLEKATHKQTRTHNTHFVLKTIYAEGRISRAEIARRTSLTRASVSSITAELIRDGLVAEVGTGPSLGGKPPTFLSVIDESRHLIGIDLADTAFTGCVLDLRGVTLHRASTPLGDRRGDAALGLVFELVDALLAKSRKKKLLGIGIGTPGLMDARRGVIRHSVVLDWQHVPLGPMLEKRYGVPVYIANDCHAAAMGELLFGEKKTISNLILLKVARGTGAGIVINGRLHYGDGFGAGEIGHSVVVDGGELCDCGRRGCLETLTSSRAIVRRARAVARTERRSQRRHFAPNLDDLTIEMVLRAVEGGDEALRPIIAEAGRYLGVAVAQLVGAYNIQHIVLAGSVARFGQLLLEPIIAEVQQRSLPALADQTTVAISQLGSNIVILGAAALLLAQELEVV